MSTRKIDELTVAGPITGAELMEVVQSGGSAQTTAADVGNSATNSVKLTGTQTVAGAKTFTGMTRLQNGTAAGGAILGADVNASTITTNTRKLFQASIRPYDTSQLDCCIFRADHNSTAASTSLDIGGTNTSATSAFTNMRFYTAATLNGLGVLREVIDSSGYHGFGGNTTPTAAIDNSGFSKLGESAPKIKQKKLTGTTPASMSSSVSVAHGLTRDKIIGYTFHYTSAGGSIYPHNRDDTASLLVTTSIDATNLVVFTGPATSTGLSRPFVCLITYEE